MNEPLGRAIRNMGGSSMPVALRGNMGEGPDSTKWEKVVELMHTAFWEGSL